MPYSLKLVLIGLLSIPVCSAVIILAPLDPTGRLGYRIGSVWTWAILKIGGIRLRVRGLERLNPHRPYIFIANHQSYIDIPIMIQALPGFQLRWIAKKELIWVPLFGWALWCAKHILVDRFNFSKATASLKDAEERIRAQDFVAEGDVTYRQVDPPLSVNGPRAEGKLQEQTFSISGGRVKTEIVP